MFRTHSRSLHFATVTLITSLYRHLLVPMSLKLIRIHRNSRTTCLNSIQMSLNSSLLTAILPDIVASSSQYHLIRPEFNAIVSPSSKMFLDLPPSLLRHHSMSHPGLKLLATCPDQFQFASIHRNSIQDT